MTTKLKHAKYLENKENTNAVLEGYRKDVIEQLRTAENNISIAITKMYQSKLTTKEINAIKQAMDMAGIAITSVYWKVQNVEENE